MRKEEKGGLAYSGLDRRITYYWGSKVLCSPGSPVRRERAGPEGLCSPCVSQPDGHNHHSAERRTPSLSSGTSRGLCRLSVVTHLLSSHTFTADSLTHTHDPGLLRSSPADGCTPARAMLIKVHPHHDSPNGAIHAEISLPLYLFPLFGALNIIISRQILTSLVKTLFTAQVRWGNNRNIICGSGEVLQRIQKMATYLWCTGLITCLGIYQSISLVSMFHGDTGGRCRTKTILWFTFFKRLKDAILADSYWNLSSHVQKLQ